MAGRATPAPLFSLCADCLAPIRLESAQALASAGIHVVGRYLETLTVGERNMLFGLGFSILPLTEGRLGALSQARGFEVGVASVRRGMALEMPPNASLTIDFEEVSADNSSADSAAYVSAFAQALSHGGYAPMLYVGAGQPLDGHALYQLPLEPYWRGGSVGIPEPLCGFAVVQAFPLDVPLYRIATLGESHPGHDDRFDISLLASDFRGRTPTLWSP